MSSAASLVLRHLPVGCQATVFVSGETTSRCQCHFRSGKTPAKKLTLRAPQPLLAPRLGPHPIAASPAGPIIVSRHQPLSQGCIERARPRGRNRLVSRASNQSRSGVERVVQKLAPPPRGHIESGCLWAVAVSTRTPAVAEVQQWRCLKTRSSCHQRGRSPGRSPLWDQACQA